MNFSSPNNPSIIVRNSQFTIHNQYCPNVDFENRLKHKLRCEFGAKMSQIDLNSVIPLHHSKYRQGMVHEQWPHDFCSALDLGLYKILQILSVTIFRKKPDFIGLFAIQLLNSRTRSLYPTGSVKHVMGQY